VEYVKNSIVMLLSLVISLVVCEAGLRQWEGVPLFEFPDFRLRQVIRDTLTGALEYDPSLGWRLKSHLSFPMFKTIDYGIRKNGIAEDDHVRTGGVLAAGASFTAGSEVDDAGTWPAQLETLIAQPVVNGGEGGFGADQIIMRAEELLPIVKPTVLVIDLVPDNIATVGYSYSGYPKPYFTMENDELVLHHSPVPRYKLADQTFDFMKEVMSYSFVVDRIMATYFRDYWYSSTGAKFERIQSDEVEVTCKLLQRLKKKTNARNIRTVMSAQYGGNYVTDTKTRTGPIVLVEECARSMGFQVVDEFDYLKNLADSDPAAFARHYVIETNGLYGHKSVFGNRRIAEMIHQALAQPAPQDEIADTANGPSESADRVGKSGENLFPNSESLDALASTSPIVSVTRAPNPTMPQVFEIRAIGENSEHYAGFTYLSQGGGQLVLSLDLRGRATSNIRVQLLDSAQNGVYSDFDFSTKKITTTRLGLGRNIDGGMKAIEGGWYRVWLTARVRNDGGSIIIQLGNREASWVFTPGDESVFIRGVAVKEGKLASPYRVGVKSN